MSVKKGVRVYTYGAIKSLAGGTRSTINLDRPWQMPVDKLLASECPFETKPQEVVREVVLGGARWRVMRCLYTPYREHTMVIPEKCWEKERLLVLGGAMMVRTALSIAAEEIRGDNGVWWIGIQIGWGAGQNVCHPHWHVLKPSVTRATTCRVNAGTLIWRKDGWVVFCGGPYTGQCVIQPRRPVPLGDEAAVNSCSFWIMKLITSGAKKFRSKQGLPPDYRVALAVEDGCIIYVEYIPILNNWGFADSLALKENGPITLKWPHEETRRLILARS